MLLGRLHDSASVDDLIELLKNADEGLAANAHWAVQKAWDYYKTRHGRNGMDNAGSNNISGFAFKGDGTIYMSSIYSVGPTGKVYQSTDDGANWTEISATLGRSFVGTARIHLAPSGRLYISDHVGLYRYTFGAGSASSNPMFFGGGV